MSRQHIHLAPTLDPAVHPITPRPSSTLYIYLDLHKLLQAGISVYTSANGVVLTPGEGDTGVVGKEYWKKVERREGKQRMVIWKEGEMVDPPRTV
jgi:2'-phosphotransferase